ncbi:unnamed protein product [Ectocarpus sp. CCAP 1310/34]|nr:unnamed protein product [Ectocarpus sp. CCAP 1310/34]
MELPVAISPACHPPPLSPLALGGGSESHGLDGWDAEDFDFEELFRDAEEMGAGTASSDGNPAAAAAPTGSPVNTSDIDLSLKAEWLERDALSPAMPTPITAAVEPTSGGTRSPTADVTGHIVSEGDISAGAAMATRTATTSTWSTTSVSEESDDGGSSCIMGGGVSPARSNDSSVGSVQAPRSTVSEASTAAAAAAAAAASNNSKRLLAVSSGAGTPILPLAFAPGFSGASSSSAAAAAALSAFPALNFSGFQAAAGQALKRLRGGDAPAGAALGQPCAGGGAAAATPPRLLSGGEGGAGRITKRAKREERLMKNREAANRSRVKRKEVLSELENRADTLSKSLAASRDETASLKQEIASLREQNSFLRGMLSAHGSAIDLPPIAPSNASSDSLWPHRHGRGRGASAAAAGASAIIGAVSTGLALISCVALSAAGFGGGSGGGGGEPRAGYSGGFGGGGGGRGVGERGYASRSGFGSKGMGGRRTLLSVDEGDPFDAYPSGGETSSQFGFGGSVGGYMVVGLVVVALLFFVARWTCRKAASHRRVTGRGRRGGGGGGASMMGSRASGGGGFDHLGGVWLMDRLFGSDKAVGKLM